jgi:hypothetical protein
VRRRVHAETNNLDWTIRLLWLPEAIRALGVRQIYSGKVGPGGRIDQASAIWGVLLSPVISIVVGMPVMAVVLPLRFAGVMSWEVEAVAWPWGKRGGPATVMQWRVKGKGVDEPRRVIDDVASALERGETEPQIAGARRV